MTSLLDLGDLLNARTASELIGTAADPEIRDVTHDSRHVGPGSLFCCVRGGNFDGHKFSKQAVAAGAVAVLSERSTGVDVPELLVDDTRVSMALAAAAVHGHPSESLRMVGVTGTNGKTTVVSLIDGVLSHSGRESRSIGTLTGERTTPESTDLQRTLAQMVSEGVTDVAIEVSSHALVSHRVDEVDFEVAVFTNLGIDHLDFHGTQEAYFAAKARLFEPGRSLIGIVCVDDVHGRLLYDASGAAFTAVSIDQAVDLSSDAAGSEFIWKGSRIHLPLVGTHNVTNALLAAEACLALGLGVDEIRAGLEAAATVPGRFETFSGLGSDGSAFTAVVDFAHTPDALEQALLAARRITHQGARLTVVFGCGGDRDINKRPLMGQVAGRFADRVIVTTDNPRSESPLAIIDDITRRMASGSFEVVTDRRTAIAEALDAASGGDVVVVAGKGHEQGQVLADRVEPFDDREVVRSILDQVSDE